MRTPVLHPRARSSVAAALYLLCRHYGNDYVFFAGYTVLQYIVLATAWNILGGYCGYVNFGSAGFFAIGAYSSVFFYTVGQNVDDLVPGFLAGAGAGDLSAAGARAHRPRRRVFAGLVGLGTGYLTLRLRGVFFAIATLALAVVLQTLIVNWDFVGGSRGAYVIPPNHGCRSSAPISSICSC